MKFIIQAGHEALESNGGLVLGRTAYEEVVSGELIFPAGLGNSARAFGGKRCGNAWTGRKGGVEFNQSMKLI